jgi:hypothetical protein
MEPADVLAGPSDGFDIVAVATRALHAGRRSTIVVASLETIDAVAGLLDEPKPPRRK